MSVLVLSTVFFVWTVEMLLLYRVEETVHSVHSEDKIDCESSQDVLPDDVHSHAVILIRGIGPDSSSGNEPSTIPGYQVAAFHQCLRDCLSIESATDSRPLEVDRQD